jgi:hypothetical protein
MKTEVKNKMTISIENFNTDKGNITISIDSKHEELEWEDLAYRFKTFLLAAYRNGKDLSEVVFKFENGSEISSKDVK